MMIIIMFHYQARLIYRVVQRNSSFEKITQVFVSLGSVSSSSISSEVSAFSFFVRTQGFLLVVLVDEVVEVLRLLSIV